MTIHGKGGHAMDVVDRLERYLARVAGTVSVLLLIAIIAVIVQQVVVRHLASQPVIWTEEAARYLLVWFTMIGAGWLGRTGAHMGLGMGAQAPATLRARVFECALYLLGTAVLVTLAVTTFEAVGTFSGSSPALRVPTSVVYLAFPVGCTLWALHSLVSVVRLALGGPAHQRNQDEELTVESSS